MKQNVREYWKRIHNYKDRASFRGIIFFVAWEVDSSMKPMCLYSFFFGLLLSSIRSRGGEIMKRHSEEKRKKKALRRLRNNN